MSPIPSRHVAAAAALAIALTPHAARGANLDPATWRGDVRFLVAAVDSIHPRPYRLYRSAAWDSAAADLESRLPTLRYDQAVAGFSRLLAMLGDGHSRLDHVVLESHGRPVLQPLPGPGFGREAPLEFEVFSDGLRITRATRGHADLLGGRVEAIDGRPTGEVAAALARLIPADNPMWTLHMLPAFLRCPGYLAAAGIAPDPTAPLRLAVTDGRGRRREVLVPAEPRDSTARWIEADADVRTPLPLTRRLPGPFALADLDDSTVYARIREIADLPGQETMAQFAERLLAHADALGDRRLILDLRGNGGGNNYLNQPLVRAVIQHPFLDRTGRLFVIVDRGTFSAAVSLAADLERETHALFVGEPTGAAPNSPGDPAHVTLPASGLVVRISTVLWQGSDPRDPREFIAPDLAVATRWDDWIGHRDPALDAVRAYHAAGGPEVPPNQRWGDPARLRVRAPMPAW